MKLIFLDIDGVLNSTRSRMKIYNDPNTSDLKRDLPYPSYVQHLNKIVAETGAKVVITSTWRIRRDSLILWYLLAACGFEGKVLGCTPSYPQLPRGIEIQAYIDIYNANYREYCKNSDNWLEQYKEPLESFVILDDNSDMEHLHKHLIKVKNEIGLTEKDAKLAIQHLNEV